MMPLKHMLLGLAPSCMDSCDILENVLLLVYCIVVVTGPSNKRVSWQLNHRFYGNAQDTFLLRIKRLNILQT